MTDPRQIAVRALPFSPLDYSYGGQSGLMVSNGSNYPPSPQGVLERLQKQKATKKWRKPDFNAPVYNRLPRKPAEMRAYNPSFSDERRYLARHLLGSSTGRKLNEAAEWVDPLTPVLDFHHRRWHNQPWDWEDAAVAANAIPVLGRPAGKIASRLYRAGKNVRNRYRKHDWSFRSSRNAANASSAISEYPQPKYYDLQKTSQRPFEQDYPSNTIEGKPIADENGDLLLTMDGDPVIAETVVGLSKLGKPDKPLTNKRAEEIIRALTGRPTKKVLFPIKDKKITYGITDLDRNTSRPKGVYVDARIGKYPLPRIVKHELGHVLDFQRMPMSVDGLQREMRRVYHYGQKRSWADQRKHRLVGPEAVGYKPEQAPVELTAEAFRQYMTNPNMFKKIAPKTAKRIREKVNNDPRLNKFIQFNDLGAPTVGVAAATGAIHGLAKDPSTEDNGNPNIPVTSMPPSRLVRPKFSTDLLHPQFVASRKFGMARPIMSADALRRSIMRKVLSGDLWT